MDVVITHEHHYQADGKGNVFTDNANSTGYKIHKRYLDVFDSVYVIARLQDGITTATEPVTGPGVKFLGLPSYLGLSQFLQRSVQIKSRIRAAVSKQKGRAAFIARTGNMGSLLIKELLKSGHPYGIEVVSDPFDVFAPGAIRHPLRPLFRIWFSRCLRQQCYRSCAVSYVTERALQKRYPPHVDSFTTHYSSIELAQDFYVSAPRRFQGRPRRILFVGTLSQLYKAPDVLLDAIGICDRQGVKIQLNIVGDGKYREFLEQRARTLGLAEKVTFLGQLPAGAKVREQMDKADLFILPSRGEGLPRAMIEAMARALPCIGSTASGIPELLSPEDLVPPEDAASLARKIAEVLADPGRMSGMSVRNLEKAKEFESRILQKRRIEFYGEVKKRTEEHWQH